MKYFKIISSIVLILCLVLIPSIWPYYIIGFGLFGITKLLKVNSKYTNLILLLISTSIIISICEIVLRVRGFIKLIQKHLRFYKKTLAFPFFLPTIIPLLPQLKKDGYTSIITLLKTKRN